MLLLIGIKLSEKNNKIIVIEFNNLDMMYKANIPVPRPIKRIGNIIRMEFISMTLNGSKCTPLIKDIDLAAYKDPSDYLHETLDTLAD